ncbi:hypothetical protein HAX54_038056 [Datura stramonium]|uniref:Uncharacterized protein n=1 Tax=Datura stramonium TaxID=4076 RepID=A0ABS8VLL1_DATST|nr:hypothetical protein [Datura stramonium]
MAPKENKEKCVASSRNGSKRARRVSEEEHEDVRMGPQQLRRYGLHLVTEQEVLKKHVTHVTRERVCLVYALMIEIPINVGVINKNVLKREGVKKGQNFGFGGLLTRFHVGMILRRKRRTIDQLMILEVDVTKTKEPKGINDLVLSVNEHNV